MFAVGEDRDAPWNAASDMLPNQLAGRDVPDFGLMIKTARNRVTAIGRDQHGADFFFMSAECLNWPSGLYVPNANC